MKAIWIVMLTVVTLVACGKQPKANKAVGDYMSYGQVISAEGALTEAEMLVKYQNLELGDTINAKFQSSIKAVCSKMGCWVDVDLGNGSVAKAKFGDHDFVIPKDTKTGTQAIVQGKAFLQTTSIKELQHMAKDAGKSKEEIENITQPKKEYRFLADGILIQ